MNIFRYKYALKTCFFSRLRKSADSPKTERIFSVLLNEVLNVPQTFEIKYCIFLIAWNLYLYK